MKWVKNPGYDKWFTNKQITWLMNKSLKSDDLLQVLFIFLLVHSGPIASLWSRQSCIFKDKQRGLESVDEGSGPNPAISRRLFIVSSSTEVGS